MRFEYCAARFNTNHIFIGINTQVFRMKGLNQCLSDQAMLAGSDQGRGLASGDFLCKAGATEHTGMHARCNLGLHFVSQ